MIDVNNWVVLELSSKAEGEDPDVIRASIRHHLRDAEVFIPASVVQRGDVREVHYLVDGYAFVRHKHQDAQYLKLEDTKYVHSPLYNGGSRRERKLATVPTSEIDKLRAKIQVEVDQGIEVGDTVLITTGPYKNIVAVVNEEIKELDSVIVHIRLRSTDRLITLPRAFMRLEFKSPVPKVRAKLQALLRKVESALALELLKRQNLRHLAGKLTRLQWISGRIDRVLALTKLLAISSDAEVKLTTFQSRIIAALPKDEQASVTSGIPNLSQLHTRYTRYSQLAKWCNDILRIYQSMRQLTSDSPINIIVDGTQLFIRCLEAPGLNALSDSKGRITGPVTGFLRSLASYKKRFPNSTVYVCWDGKSERRKQLYPEYKANRKSGSGAVSFGWAWLRDTLPSMGVIQVYNPSEEADDAMATLVRGPLKDSINVMVTTDRDLLQVVSETTLQLTPASGPGKEKLYDPELVEKEYGVKPTDFVQLKALMGDTSDNIPGVPNFGVKTAAKAIRLHHSIISLLKSNLAGLSQIQATNLRASASQVALNVELMTLRDVALTEVPSSKDPAVLTGKLQEIEMKLESVVPVFFNI